MFCKNCGKELHNDAVMCVNCGKVVNAEFFRTQPALPAVQSAPNVQPAPMVKKVNGFAIAGFVLSFFGIVSWLCAVLGLVFSIIGVSSSKKTNSGKGLGIAGIVISSCGFVISCILMILVLPYIIRAIAGVFVLLLLCLVFI